MAEINAWWTRMPEERYWLDVAGRIDGDDTLAAPCAGRATSDSWARRLITHVKRGDIIFRFNRTQQSIVGWSTSTGRVEKIHLAWPRNGAAPKHGHMERVLSWGIGLRDFNRLDTPISLDQVARLQSKLFPALRALEDEVGDPLYYPFAMGDQAATRVLFGYVLKVPAVLAEGFFALTGTASRAPVEHHARTLERQLSA